MNSLKIFSQILFVGLLFCANCELTPVDLCRNGIHDKTNGETGIDCGTPWKPCREVDTFKEMVIIDTAVVNHLEAKTGHLSFGHLINNMTTPSVSKEDLVLSFLQSWEKEQKINTFPVTPRSDVKNLLIKPWMTADGQADVPIEEWIVNLDNAPFKLLAVVNRMDLIQIEEDSIKNSGEGRFVFCAIGPNKRLLPFTIIFEYQLPILDTAQIYPLASKWHALGERETFDSSYIAQLIEITEAFVGKNVMPNKPNGNALNQIRTNEVAMSFPWELREFNIDARQGIFKEVTRKMTPDISLNGSPLLSKFVQEHKIAIDSGNFTIPLTYDGQPFLGGSCPTNTSSFQWNIPGVNRETVKKFSIKTCNGCHAGDTGTPFTHIGPSSSFSKPARLSSFLMGDEMDVRVLFMHKRFLKIDQFGTTNDTMRVAAMSHKEKISIEELIKKRANNVH